MFGIGAGQEGPLALPANGLLARSFELMVVMGESTAVGACASDESRRYANVVAHLIGELHGRPVCLVNKGIGANCISPRSPCYVASRKPSAIERYREDVNGLDGRS